MKVSRLRIKDIELSGIGEEGIDLRVALKMLVEFGLIKDPKAIVESFLSQPVELASVAPLKLPNVLPGGEPMQLANGNYAAKCSDCDKIFESKFKPKFDVVRCDTCYQLHRKGL